MKIMLRLLSFAMLCSFANAAAPAVGSISPNQQFARKSSNGFDLVSLDDYEGKILVIMMMTPWCPICQTNSQAVGNGLLDHFDSPSRGNLRGKNDNGVPIQSVLLSTEQAASWDETNQSFSAANGFNQWGLDANAQRQNPRQLLAYFRGGFINSNNLSEWGNDRRRIVVLNLVNGSTSHSFREIIINQNFYTSSNNVAARAAVNAILPQAAATPPSSIELNQGETGLRSGLSTVSFGKVTPGNSATLTFTIRNNSTSDLAGIAASLSGEQAADFQVSSPINTTIAPNQTTSFTITFTPLAIGTQKAILNVTTTTAGTSPFTVNLSGTSGQPSPEIEIQQQNRFTLVDGKTKLSFGSAKVRGRGKSLNFIITNTGDAMLTDLALTKSGNHRKDFIVSFPADIQLAPGASASFKVSFMPRGAGSRKATLKLISNDADESPFDISVTGVGAR